MRWDLNKLNAFMESQRNDPFEFNRLCTKDPAGRVWAAFKKAEFDLMNAKKGLQALGVGKRSLDPATTSELEVEIAEDLVTRATMLNGLQSICDALNGYVDHNEEPRVSYFQHWIAALKSSGRGDQVPAVEVLINALEAIATSCFA